MSDDTNRKDLEVACGSLKATIIGVYHTVDETLSKHKTASFKF